MRAAVRWLVSQRMLPLAQTTGTGSLRLTRRLRGVVTWSHDADAKLHYIYIYK
jgi:hypothetical protein